MEHDLQDAPEGLAQGKVPAITGLIMGVLAVVFWFVSSSGLLSLVFGIVGVVEASKARRLGFPGGMATGGFVLSLLGLLGGGISFLTLLAGLSLLLTAG